jgi:FkbM family methyltransferase
MEAPLPSHEGRTANALLLGLREAVRLRQHAGNAEADTPVLTAIDPLPQEIRRRLDAAIRRSSLAGVLTGPFFSTASTNAAAIDQTFSMLADPLSIEVLEWVLRFRLLLAVYPQQLLHAELNGPLGADYWQQARRRAHARTDLPKGLSPRGYTAFWGMGANSLPGLCEVEPGATVIEVGASHGDCTLYLASLAGPNGHVHAFELLPENHRKLIDNLALNSAHNVTAINQALWDQIGPIQAVFSGDGSRIGAGPTDAVMGSVEATTMDQYCQDATLDRVDFIKIDAPSGSEHILLGARETLQRYRPRLAVNIHYNGGVDYFKIPELVRKMVRGKYKYYIRHYGPIHRYTILYAAPVS